MFPNAATPLAIPTYEGSGQCVHPDVTELPVPFMDARLIMAFEPYPFADSSLENPSIAVSDDGIHWRVPVGVMNPIVHPPRSGWHSDATFAWTRGDRLSLYYRYNSGDGGTSLLRSSSGDGVSWSLPETVLRFEPSGKFASPSIFASQGRLTMVYVDTIGEGVLTMTSTDGRHWERPTPILSFPRAWHAAARLVRGIIYLLLTDARHLYLLRFCSDWQQRGPHGWVPFSRRELAAPVLSPSADGWDSSRIYRASFLMEGGSMRVWYSARSWDGQWHIGYTEGQVE